MNHLTQIVCAILAFVSIVNVHGASEFRITGVSLTDGPVIQGDALPLRIDVESTASGSIPVEFDCHGVLIRLGIVIRDSEGRTVPRVVGRLAHGNLLNSGPPMPHAMADIYKLAPGDKLSLQYDLAKIFTITNGGLYNVTIASDPNEKVERKVDIIQLHALSKIHVKGVCSDWPGCPFPLGFLQGGRRVEVDVLICETRDGTGGGESFLVMRDVQTPSVWLNRTLGQARLRVLQGVQIDTALLDASWTLWVRLKHEERYSLIRCNLSSDSVETVYDWQDSKPVLSETPCRGIEGARIILFGAKKNEVKAEF
jgi:hypothetical protein